MSYHNRDSHRKHRRIRNTKFSTPKKNEKNPLYLQRLKKPMFYTPLKKFSSRNRRPTVGSKRKSLPSSPTNRVPLYAKRRVLTSRTPTSKGLTYDYDTQFFQGKVGGASQTIPTWFYLSQKKGQFNVRSVRSKSLRKKDTTRRHYQHNDEKFKSHEKEKIPQINLYREPKGIYNATQARFQHSGYLNTKKYDHISMEFDRCWGMRRKKGFGKHWDKKKSDDETTVTSEATEKTDYGPDYDVILEGTLED